MKKTTSKGELGVRDSGCRLCDMIARTTEGCPAELWDHVLLGSDRFVAVPSIGSIVPGWVLIVPRQHALCMGELDTTALSELHQFSSEVHSATESLFGPSVHFEHGPATHGSVVGCSVDHAHLHVVPTNCDLLTGASALSRSHLSWRIVSGLHAAKALHQLGLPYLLLKQERVAHIATADAIESQLFRRVIADHVGRPEYWNWRQHPEMENAEVTVRAFATRVR